MSHPLSRKLCRPQAGQRFVVGKEEYALEGKIGDGAIGLVRKARRLRDKSLQAIKLLAPDPKYIDESSYDDVAARFKREGERGLRLDHPCLVKTHKYIPNEASEVFGGNPKNPFIIMDHVNGKTLESYIKSTQRPQPLQPEPHGETRDCHPIEITAEKLDIAIQITEGIEYLHKKKLVHRDIKPANIFLSKSHHNPNRYKVQLGDFGIVKWGDFHASLTTGALTVTGQRGLGTMKYMSPEQAIAPNKVGTRSDMYSLGITLFELFTGHILLSPHHVYEVSLARLSRGTTVGRFFGMGYKLEIHHQDIGEVILDMHLRGTDGRPSAERIRGVLRRCYEQLTEREWRGP